MAASYDGVRFEIEFRLQGDAILVGAAARLDPLYGVPVGGGVLDWLVETEVPAVGTLFFGGNAYTFDVTVATVSEAF